MPRIEACHSPHDALLRASTSPEMHAHSVQRFGQNARWLAIFLHQRLVHKRDVETRIDGVAYEECCNLRGVKGLVNHGGVAKTHVELHPNFVPEGRRFKTAERGRAGEMLTACTP